MLTVAAVIVPASMAGCLLMLVLVVIVIIAICYMREKFHSFRPKVSSLGSLSQRIHQAWELHSHMHQRKH